MHIRAPTAKACQSNRNNFVGYQDSLIESLKVRNKLIEVSDGYSPCRVYSCLETCERELSPLTGMPMKVFFD